MKNSHFAFSTLIITFLAFSISLYAVSDADTSNTSEVQSVEKPIDSMNESELQDKQADLLAEEKELVAFSCNNTESKCYKIYF